MTPLRDRVLHAENVIHYHLVARSVAVLRVAVGLVFFGFGVLKFFPGVSPAQNLTEATTHILFLGLVPGDVAIVGIATLECVIGLCLIAGQGMRLAVWLLAVEFVGILSPIVLLPGRLFAGPHHAPTLEGQYVLKDIILVGAGMVIAAASFRGGQMIRTDLPPTIAVPGAGEEISAEEKLRLVVAEATDPNLADELCRRSNITPADLHNWRQIAVTGATQALDDD